MVNCLLVSVLALLGACTAQRGGNSATTESGGDADTDTDTDTDSDSDACTSIGEWREDFDVEPENWNIDIDSTGTPTSWTDPHGCFLGTADDATVWGAEPGNDDVVRCDAAPHQEDYGILREFCDTVELRMHVVRDLDCGRAVTSATLSFGIVDQTGNSHGWEWDVGCGGELDGDDVVTEDLHNYAHIPDASFGFGLEIVYSGSPQDYDPVWVAIDWVELVEE